MKTAQKASKPTNPFRMQKKIQYKYCKIIIKKEESPYESPKTHIQIVQQQLAATNAFYLARIVFCDLKSKAFNLCSKEGSQYP